MNSKFVQIIVRVILIIVLLVASILFYIQNFPYSGNFTSVLVFIALVEFIRFIQRIFKVYDTTIESILNDDFSANYKLTTKRDAYGKLFQMYDQLKSRKNEIQYKELIYRDLINNIESSILILQVKEESEIFMMNDYFSNTFQIPKISKWKYLKNYVNNLCSFIEERKFEEFKTHIDIQIDGKDLQTFIIQTSKTIAFEQEFYVIILESIQSVIDKKEKEAWINLMDIISHELMNSLTPIQTLTQNLKEIVNQEAITQEDFEDIRNSVMTISNRGDHLQHFVESYRKLAMLPSPQKESIEIRSFVSSLVDLFESNFKEQKIEFIFHTDLLINIEADKKQLEQVFVNLISNSIFALEDQENKKIECRLLQSNNWVIIQIIDNGVGVDPKIKDKIFAPFYTTRNNGAGIGLTLSKNIIESHGGYLKYKEIEAETCFEIYL